MVMFAGGMRKPASFAGHMLALEFYMVLTLTGSDSTTPSLNFSLQATP
jgi:hypothetical protein